MELLAAFIFLTRLPLPFKGELKNATLAASTAFFPLVGSVLGGTLAGIFYLLLLFLPLSISLVTILILYVLFTGALHLDGFMDTLDGLGCRGDRKKKLAVMKDSRVGAFGATGVSLLFLLKFFLLWELGQKVNLIPLIIVLPALSRWGMVIVMFRNSYPRREGGVGQAFVEMVSQREILIATFWIAIILWSFFTYQGGYFLIGILLFSLLQKCYFKKHLGGVTGDMLGFINETNEICFLFLILFIYK